MPKPKIYNKEQINVTAQTDTYVIIQFKTFKVIFIYLPPTKLIKYSSFLDNNIDENTLVTIILILSNQEINRACLVYKTESNWTTVHSTQGYSYFLPK